MITNLALSSTFVLGPILAGLLPLGLQAADPGPAPSPQAASTRAADAVEPAMDPAESAGRALLLKAARFQSPEPRERVPDTLHGVFEGTIRTPDGSGSVSVERWFTRTPERLLTRHTENFTGSRQTIGWDGRQAWFRDDDTGQVVIYTDDAELFAVDLERLEEQRRMTRLLLDAIVLDTLIPRMSHVRAGGESTWEDLEGDEHRVRRVHAELPDELYPAPSLALPPGSVTPERWLALDLSIDVETGALWRVGVSAVGRPELVPLELRFDFHDRTRSGLTVPGNVRVRRAGEVEDLISLGVAFDEDDLLMLEIDGEIDAERFAPPAG